MWWWKVPPRLEVKWRSLVSPLCGCNPQQAGFSVSQSHTYPCPMAIYTLATPCAQPHLHPKACVTPTGVCSPAPPAPPARDPEITASCE